MMFQRLRKCYTFLNNKKSDKAWLTLSLFFMLFSPVITDSWGDRLYTNETRATVVAPAELAPRERSGLQRQYTYEVRQKALLLTPYSPGLQSGDVPLSSNNDEQSEQEKLYRYFGIAMSLAKEGRLEEAADILQYILRKNPDDRYVQESLTRIRKGSEFKKRRFKGESATEASQLKKTMLKNIIKDGIAYYNNKNFDMAILKFADALAIDPANPAAGRYMNELKKLYSKEIEVKNIARNWMAGKAAYDRSERAIPVQTEKPERKGGDGLKQAAEDLLNNENSKYGLLDKRAIALLDRNEDETRADIEAAAEKLLDAKKMDYTILDKRAVNLLNETELEADIKEMIENKKADEKKSDQFTFGPGDVLQISVRDHPELSGQTVVQLKGEVVLPLVNDAVMAKDLNTDELTEKVTAILSEYVQNPIVNIAVIEYKSKMFYVIDEDSCTPYPITRAYLTLRDALFISDWGNNRALGRVLVIKPSKRNPIIKKVDGFDLIFRGNLQNNIRIDDGDVIYVPMTITAKITKVIYDSIAPFRAIRNARDEYLNLKWNQKDWKAIGRIPVNYSQEAMDAQDLSVYGSLKDLAIQ